MSYVVLPRTSTVSPELFGSPYRVGMSSLGYQRVYREIQDIPGVCCERVFN